MTRPAADYLVYSCDGCDKRIFTERIYLGRTGVCPCCGVQHTVGGLRVAKEASDRRAAPRASDPRAKVELKETSSAERVTGLLSRGELLPLRDLSELGVSFNLPGVPDPRTLAGVRPPQVKVGDRFAIALHAPRTSRPRNLLAEVRRVDPGEPGQWTIGAEFVNLDESLTWALREIVGQMLERDERDEQT